MDNINACPCNFAFCNLEIRAKKGLKLTQLYALHTESSESKVSVCLLIKQLRKFALTSDSSSTYFAKFALTIQNNNNNTHRQTVFVSFYLFI